MFFVYKLITTFRDSDGLSIRFDRDCGRRRDELSNNKNMKAKHHVRIMLEDVFGFAEHQEEATYGLGCNLTLTRNKDDEVCDEAAGIAVARIKVDPIHWYVPHYKPSIQQQGILSKQILIKTPRELRYIERSVFRKEINNQNSWSFELSSQESMNVTICIIIGFQQNNKIDKVLKI